MKTSASVPPRCCHSCTPSTRCSSRATTCWTRSTRTWRNWLLRWAKLLHHRSARCSIELSPGQFPLGNSVWIGIGLILIWTIDKQQLHKHLNFCFLFDCQCFCTYKYKASSFGSVAVQASCFNLFFTAGWLRRENWIDASLQNTDLTRHWRLSLHYSHLLWIVLTVPLLW